MYSFHIPQCTIQNGDVHISVLNGALWDMEEVHCAIYEIGLLVVNRYYHVIDIFFSFLHTDGSVQERRNSIADALELRLSCTNPSI